MKLRRLPFWQLLLGLLLVASVARAQSGRYEAENGFYNGNFNNDPNIPFSGSGFVDYLIYSYSSSVGFNVTAPTKDIYKVSLRYAAALAGDRYMQVFVDNVDKGIITLPSTGGWNKWRSGIYSLPLTAGSHTIEYRVLDTGSNYGWVNVDYLWLTREAGNGPIAQPIAAGDQLLVAKLVQLPLPASSPVTSGSYQVIVNNLASSGNRLFAADAAHGVIHEFYDSPGLRGSSQEFFSVRAGLTAAGHRLYAYNSNGSSATNDLVYGGIRGLAFHPDFANNGKFYTSQLEFQSSAAHPISQNASNYIGPQYSTAPQTIEVDWPAQPVSTVVEWTCTTRNSQNQFTGANVTYREVCRIALPGLDRNVDPSNGAYNSPGTGFDHYIGEIHFGPDGMLYIAHGDCREQSGGGGLTYDPLAQNDAMGKVLRINPAPTAPKGYTVPTDNPGIPGVPAEVFARGFRNPHTFDFWQRGGTWHLILADAGRNNVEEVNLLLPGRHYGWPYREGTFEHHRTFAADPLELVSPVPSPPDAYEYPAAQWGHVPAQGQAIAGGVLYDNPVTGRAQYMFADLAGTGRFFYCNATDLLSANRNQANGPLAPAPVKQYALLYDSDINNPTNPLEQFPTLTAMLSRGRSDIRFMQGPNGSLYFSSKQTGCVYRIKNVEPGNAYEAELASWSSGINVHQNAAASNGAFLGDINNVGQSVTFAVSVPATGLYNVEMRYANGLTDDRTLTVQVDGQSRGRASFAPTGGWTTWQTQTVTLRLTAGTRQIRYYFAGATKANGFLADNGRVNPDCIRLKPATYEAEDAETDARREQSIPGYRGTGYVDNIIIPSNYVQFNVYVPLAGTLASADYDVSVRYAVHGTPGQLLGVVVNGLRMSGQDQVWLPTTNSWYIWATATHTVTLQAGWNTLRYEYDPNQGDTGWANLDYIELQLAGAPCSTCQPNARPAAAPTLSRPGTDLAAYPNPAADAVQLPAGTTRAELLNQVGQTVLSQEVAAGGELSVRNLPEGLYLLRLQVDGKSHVQRFSIKR